MYDFDYQRPATLADARKALAASDDAVALAGGQTLIPTLKLRLRRPSAVVDLSAMPDLAGVRQSEGYVVIGAMTTHAAVAASPEVNNAIPALAALAGGIGDIHVRHRGTIGGSIANADPAADYPAAVVALGATILTDKREIAADRFFTGLFETALEPGEIITAVRFPVPDKAAYAKFPNPASRFALAGVFVARFKTGVRVAVTGAAPCVFRVPTWEAALKASFTAGAVDEGAVPADGLNSDIHADADYRAHLVGVMARRAVQACA